MNKPCKLCKKERFANTSWCLKHYKEREKNKKEEKIRLKKEKKEQTKGFKESLRKKLHKKAWSLMSEYVRSKDANLDGFNECYTCGIVKQWKELQAGHFKHGRLDFDERNLKPQCPRCNTHLSGRLDVYAENLIRDNGLEWFNQLTKDSWSHTGYSVMELSMIIQDLNEKLNIIRNKYV